MKIVKTEGCVVSGININDVDIFDLSDEDKVKYYNQALDWLKDNYSEQSFNDIINFIVDTFGNCKYLYTCEQCGDSVHETTLKI